MAELPAFSKSQLASLFGIHRQTVASRLANVAPCAKDKRGHGTWTIPVAAQYLVDYRDRMLEGDEDGEQDPDKMPPDMAKDYWDSQLKKQSYLTKEGDLWETQQVVDGVAAFAKPVASGLASLPDMLERKLSLTPKQVQAMDQEIKRIRNDMYKALQETFSGKLPETE